MFNNKIRNARKDKRLEKLSALTTKSRAILNLGVGTREGDGTGIFDRKNPDQLSGSQAATMVVSVRDDYGHAVTTGSLTVLVSGTGLLGTGTGPATDFIPTGRAISVHLSNSVPGKYVFSLFGAGVGSV